MSNFDAFLLVFIGLPAFFIGLITVVGRLEKRLVWQYGDGTLAPYLDATGGIAPWVAGAVAGGFRLLGWAADPRAPGCRLNGEAMEPQFESCWKCGTVRADPLQ